MSAVLPTLSEPAAVKKCIVTRGALPSYIDPAHPPTKRKPVATLLGLKWCHHIDLLLPIELVDTIKSHFANPPTPLTNTKYAQAFLTLPDILSDPFFTTYIKTRTVAMRSEGRHGIDAVYSILNGTLTLQLPAHVYQRTGLTGKPMPHAGLKHKKEWFEVSYDLRQPSMLHGKKGFERLVWAARNVLNERRMWVFVEIAERAGKKRGADGEVKGESGGEVGEEEVEGPIEAFHPTWCHVEPVETVMEGVGVPRVLERDVWDLRLRDAADGRKGLNSTALNHDERDSLEEVLEYLSLIAIDSPRVKEGDKVDPYICRYDLPGASGGDEENQVRTTSLTRLRWTGFLPCQSFGLAMIMALKAALEPQVGEEKIKDRNRDERWATLIMHGIEGETATLLMRDESDRMRTAEPSTSAPVPTKADAGTANDGRENAVMMDVDAGETQPSERSQTSTSDAKKGLPSKRHKGGKSGSVGFIEWSHQHYLVPRLS